MKKRFVAASLLLAALVGFGALSSVVAGEKKDQAALAAAAKVSESEARAIALGKVANGTIKEGGIEKEKGRVVWSFDIATPDTKNITEVQVDANSGEVVSVATETPDDEAREAKPEKKGKKHKQEKDEDDEKEEHGK